MTNTNQDLNHRIEQIVREHIEATHKTAREALDRAFASAARAPAITTRRVTSSLSAKATRTRRASAELVSLGDRFYRAVCAKPGETMTVLAAEVGASARELHRAVARLKQTGQVRSIGSRSKTRYFPRSSEAGAQA